MKLDFLSINWFGFVMGMFLLALPFLGPWWVATAGTGAMEIAFSPFDMRASLFGKSIGSSLVEIFLLFTKITFVIAGVLIILGSLFSKNWWAKHLIRFGVMKPFWSVIGLLVVVVIGAFIFNNVLPGIISGPVGGAGSATTQFIAPYISGSTTSTVQIGDMATITVPIAAHLTWTFWVAVGVAALGIVTRIYQRRLTKVEKQAPPEKIKVKLAEEKKIIKLKPAKEK